ncbi:MAG: mitochondrial 37S ribosomal protein rsm10 [Chrysothrix sp. TS-e1954]|nr:MAG: mitochondrial 37S ribosomal protein rsm10 [Chrysothrix sp. TS-e1954]
MTHSIASPWNAFKRLRISVPLSTRVVLQKSSLSTTTRMQQDDAQNQAAKPESAVKRDENTLEETADEELGENTSRDNIRSELVKMAENYKVAIPTSLTPSPRNLRAPRAVDTRLLSPLRRSPTHGITVCNLQLRSFSARNLEFMADFALRAAYYLNLPAKGPVPLPRMVERMTVPRSHFVNKKSQENFERVTMRRLVQIQDGHPEAVQRWLAFIRKWAWYGVGMKADVWEWEGTGTAARMDANEDAVRKGLENVDWNLIRRQPGHEGEDQLSKLLDDSGWAGAGHLEPRTDSRQSETQA